MDVFDRKSSMLFSITSVWIVMTFLPIKIGILALWVALTFFSSLNEYMIAFTVFYLLLVLFTEVVHILVKPLFTQNSLASSTVKSAALHVSDMRNISSCGLS